MRKNISRTIKTERKVKDLARAAQVILDSESVFEFDDEPESEPPTKESALFRPRLRLIPEE